VVINGNGISSASATPYASSFDQYASSTRVADCSSYLRAHLLAGHWKIFIKLRHILMAEYS
jgi:hypothetical protein